MCFLPIQYDTLTLLYIVGSVMLILIVVAQNRGLKSNISSRLRSDIDTSNENLASLGTTFEFSTKDWNDFIALFERYFDNFFYFLRQARCHTNSRANVGLSGPLSTPALLGLDICPSNQYNMLESVWQPIFTLCRDVERFW